MTLEDFFTSTEMSNGLATPVQVHELVAVMQKEKNNDNKSVSDATRQWSAVARTIAATENKDCLQLFIQLDGLNFIDRWLKNAQKFCNDSSDNNNYSIEESITDLLRAVEKLHVGNEESVSSGIKISVEKLLGHGSSMVREMANALIVRWKNGTDTALNVEKVDGEIKVTVNPKEVNALSESSCDVHHSKEGWSEHDRDSFVPSLRSDNLHSEMVGEETYEIVQDEPSPYANTRDEKESSKLHPEGTLNEHIENSILVPGDDAVFLPSAETKDVVDESGSENDCRSASSKSDSEWSQGSSYKHNLEYAKEVGTSSSKVETIGVEVYEEILSDQSGDDLNTDLGKLYMGNKDILDKKADLDLDCGILDPLEVALQVAMEVEREFEQSCNSMKKTAKIHDHNSSDSESEKRCESTSDGSNKEAQEGIRPIEASQAGGKDLNIVGNSNGAAAVNETQDMDSSQVTMVAVELEANSEKGLCEFDLNQDVFSEDTDQPLRSIAASGVPIASSKAESDGSSKQRHGCLDIDLNVAEAGDDERCMGLNHRDDAAVSSVLPSGESSVEASSKIPERADLDLNRITDEGETPSDWRMDRQLSSSQNGPQNQSPSSSSSSKQPAFLNIDLNDNPGFLNDSSYLTNPPQNLSSAVSIMGTRVDVNQKEPLSQSMPLANGGISDPVLDVNRSAFGMESLFSYAHTAGYNGYNGITPGHAIPYGPAGPIPYMVDFKGVPVIPQIIGPASSMASQFPQQPFIFSMMGQPLTNGASMMPSGGSFDLNSGLSPEAGLGGLRQMFSPLQPNSQPSTSLSIGGKRKEPDGGWEPYPFNQHQPPWK